MQLYPFLEIGGGGGGIPRTLHIGICAVYGTTYFTGIDLIHKFTLDFQSNLLMYAFCIVFFIGILEQFYIPFSLLWLFPF